MGVQLLCGTVLSLLYTADAAINIPKLVLNVFSKKGRALIRNQRSLCNESASRRTLCLFTPQPRSSSLSLKSASSPVHQAFSEMHTESNEATGIYVHIPYCRRRCSYCDFAIVPIGNHHKSAKSHSGFQRMDQTYKEAITTEINLLIQSLKDQSPGTHLDGQNKIRLSSIYFGGGTPSLAPIETVKCILDHILESQGVFVLEDCAEVTIEMDPGTFTEDHLLKLKDIGFNRISLGVQSFDDVILEGIGRVHRKKDIFEAIRHIENVFGSESANYSLDLISGLPGLTLDMWKTTLRTALSVRPVPNHLSIYDLQIEEGTVFGKWYSDRDEEEDDDDVRHDPANNLKSLPQLSTMSSANHLNLPSASDCAEMYRYASRYLYENGFEHYEISSYARIKRGKDVNLLPENKPTSQSFRSRHNQIYWRVDSEWYAVGLSSTSCIRGKRYARPRLLADYMDWVKKNQPQYSWLPANDSDGKIDEDDEVEEILLETIMTRLRTKEGLDLDWIASQNDGVILLERVLKGAQLGLDLGLALHLKEKSGTEHGSLRLVDPEGFLFSNSIISSIFAELQ